MISRFYSLVGTMIFLMIGGDAWTLRGLGRSFELVPLTDAPRLASLVGGVEQVFATIFTAALEIAAPVLVALLITDVAFGVVSRVVPAAQRVRRGLPDEGRRRRCWSSRASLPFVANWIAGQLSVSVGAALGALHVSLRSWPSDDRTEKATPKHRKRARDKGQVARSARPQRLARADRGAADGEHDRAGHRRRRRRDLPRDPRRHRPPGAGHDGGGPERPDALGAVDDRRRGRPDRGRLRGGCDRRRRGPGRLDAQGCSRSNPTSAASTRPPGCETCSARTSSSRRSRRSPRSPSSRPSRR